MYVCGPTVYDEPHIGHLRSAYVFDMIRRYLEYSGYKVAFVRNVTDVDDKIIDKAKESNSADLIEEVKKISGKYYDAYKADLTKLGIKEPTTEPFATRHIEEMVFLIQKLLEKGAAYQSEGDVYYSVQTFGGYGKLSNQKKDSMLEHVRIDANEKKKDPLDFALWKKAKEGEPAWDSPWGKGRPGWHLECSAMSMKYLGESFDIHGGGLDLIFPHHENEIAQSEAATGKPFVKCWIHHGLVTREGHKMSKSLHNYLTLKAAIKDIEIDARKEALKLMFLNTHYRAPLDYTEERISMEKTIWKRFFNLYLFADQLKVIHKYNKPKNSGQYPRIREILDHIIQAMNDDFNTPAAITGLHEMLHYAWKSNDANIILAVAKEIKELTSKLFSLNFDLFHELVGEISRGKIDTLIKERKEARLAKNYIKSDDIRKILDDNRIALMDLKDGITLWCLKID